MNKKQTSAFSLVSILLCTLLLPSNTYAEVKVEKPWIRLLPPMSKMTAAYMTLKSDREDRLLSVSSELAKSIEIHLSKEEDGSMSMEEVQCLYLPKDEEVALKPQSYHLMVMGLTRPLVEGEHHEFTLTFEHAEHVVVPVPVINP